MEQLGLGSVNRLFIDNGKIFRYCSIFIDLIKIMNIFAANDVNGVVLQSKKWISGKIFRYLGWNHLENQVSSKFFR
ncbi:hypothetical protein ACI5FR_04315 [Paenibacillus sp. HJGM_3]